MNLEFGIQIFKIRYFREASLFFENKNICTYLNRGLHPFVSLEFRKMIFEYFRTSFAFGYCIYATRVSMMTEMNIYKLLDDLCLNSIIVAKEILLLPWRIQTSY